jgi:hypothetical protein
LALGAAADLPTGKTKGARFLPNGCHRHTWL